MSELKTNKISTNDGNNVAIDNSLGLKSYTTTQRNALTSAAGDMIYNTTDSKVQVYTGSAWEDLGGVDVVQVEYAISAGGGAGGNGHSRSGGGGGGGGYRTNHSSDKSGGNSSTEPNLYLIKSNAYAISVGAGGAGEQSNYGGSQGSDTYMGQLFVSGGGGGAGRSGNTLTANPYGGSAGGAHNTGNSADGDGRGGGYTGKIYQGNDSGAGNNSNNRAGGGGGSLNKGGFADDDNGQEGGDGCISTLITTTQASAQSVGEVDGSNVHFAAGGGGSGNSSSSNGTGGKGGGGDATTGSSVGGAATANTGGGGGANTDISYLSGAGGSGLVVFRVADTITVSGFTGLTYATQTTGGYKYYFITQGTGTVTFS